MKPRSASELELRPQKPPQMRIRRFEPGEEPALFDIYHSAIHLIASRDYTEEQINAWAPVVLDEELWVRRIRGINPFVAELEGALVGYADVQESGYIDHFFVSGRHPRRGIGRSLMEVLQSEAMRLGVTELTSDVSRTAQPFFARFGFQIIEQRVPVVRGIELPNARMRKFI
jgi:putative acetyltransferase